MTSTRTWDPIVATFEMRTDRDMAVEAIVKHRIMS